MKLIHSSDFSEGLIYAIAFFSIIAGSWVIFVTAMNISSPFSLNFVWLGLFLLIGLPAVIGGVGLFSRKPWSPTPISVASFFGAIVACSYIWNQMTKTGPEISIRGIIVVLACFVFYCPLSPG